MRPILIGWPFIVGSAFFLAITYRLMVPASCG